MYDDVKGVKLAQAKHGKFFEAFKWVVDVTDENTLEIQNSTCSIIVGFLILVGGNQMYANNPHAWQMFEALPIWVWGSMYLAAGVSHLVALKLKWHRARKWVLLVKATLWVFLGTALAVGIGWLIPAVYIYYVFALVAFRGYFKIQVGGQ